MLLFSNIKYLFRLISTKREAHLLLGGNLGHVRETFSKAEALLADSLQISRKSSFYESEAWGMESENLFLNQVWVVETHLEPEALLSKILAVESALGRERAKAPMEGYYIDRTLDIDILFIQDMVLDSDKLVIPHPKLHLRAFTLQALVEMDPNMIHPILRKSIHNLLENCTDNVRARKLIGG